MIKKRDATLFCVESGGYKKLAFGGEILTKASAEGEKVIAMFPVVKPEQLGAKRFRQMYNTQYAYYAGAMANGISSVEMLVKLGKKGFMGSLGTGGMEIEQIAQCIDELQSRLKQGPYLINLLNSIHNPEKENKIVQIFLNKGVKAIEASAFINISEALVYYRLSGLKVDGNGEIISTNHIIAKISREEVAVKFMNCAPTDMVEKLLAKGKITKEQAELSKFISMADDITVESDSGGHTDNRPLISLLPAIISLNNQIQDKNQLRNKVRIGAGGGIGTAAAALAAFQMGAAYIVTGSVNQSCIEAGTSDRVKETLRKVRMQDVVMAPCADMFEMGVKVQVIKKGTMFPQNAQKLYQYYQQYAGLEDIPQKYKSVLEERIFCCSLDDIWKLTKAYFLKVDPLQIKRADANAKFKMSLVFRWYLGQSAKWAITGEADREFDMQIWCGQSMGAFNSWVEGTKYEESTHRKAVDVAKLIICGAAYLANIQNGILAGVHEESRFSLEHII